MMLPESPHLSKVYESWVKLEQRKTNPLFELDGDHLHISDVVGTAYHDCTPQLSSRQDVIQKLEESVKVLMTHLAKGYYVYGVNTGFGGSADSRTEEVVALQAALMQLTQVGILSPFASSHHLRHAMPASWVRATMVTRLNATMRGNSAVSLPILKAIASLLEHRLTPVVPLRGSVSASGDLMPLSYISGAIEGNPDIFVEKHDGTILPAHVALQDAGLTAVTLGPKEGLGLVNGTASSAALGALVMAQAQNLAVLTQALSAMAVEALRGSSESFNPFIAKVRPHPGQIESARTILMFLGDSRLARDVHAPKDRRQDDLIQDRYSLRSAPQWIGPQLEDLQLAEQQISIELNSSCDNPLVDTESGDILYGCNFQAASVTSAMEKVRLSLQMFGRLMFSQLTEMVDPHLSGGLPANLASDNPSLSFTMKGVEISMAAYMAELSFLANPMSSHVQAAEMHNQSVNSMAFASARISQQAIEVLMLMSACSLYCGCQALDLRALHMTFVRDVIRELAPINSDAFGSCMEPNDLASLQNALGSHFAIQWNNTGKLDLEERCTSLVASSIPIVVAITHGKVANIVTWRDRASAKALEVWKSSLERFSERPYTSEMLGKGSKALYNFIRGELGVPFHHGLIEHPTRDSDTLHGRPKKTIGGWISIIHEAIREGVIYEPLMRLVEESCVSLNGTSGVNGANGKA